MGSRDIGFALRALGTLTMPGAFRDSASKAEAPFDRLRAFGRLRFGRDDLASRLRTMVCYRAWPALWLGFAGVGRQRGRESRLASESGIEIPHSISIGNSQRTEVGGRLFLEC